MISVTLGRFSSLKNSISELDTVCNRFNSSNTELEYANDVWIFMSGQSQGRKIDSKSSLLIAYWSQWNSECKSSVVCRCVWSFLSFFLGSADLNRMTLMRPQLRILMSSSGCHGSFFKSEYNWSSGDIGNQRSKRSASSIRRSNFQPKDVVLVLKGRSQQMRSGWSGRLVGRS